MFPFADTKRKMDSYGEVIDAERWMSRGREMERQAAERDLEHEAKRRKMEEEADATPVEPPSKYISEEVDVEVRCQVVYIDMEGLNDSRAIKNIMPRLNPRKVVGVDLHNAKHANIPVDTCRRHAELFNLSHYLLQRHLRHD